MKRLFIFITMLAIFGGAVAGLNPSSEAGPAQNGYFFVDYRHLDGGEDGVALIDLDPESPTFGQILQQMPIGDGVLPHHLYFNQSEDRLYTTALGGASLYEIKLDFENPIMPRITEVIEVDTEGSFVGEDIYFTEDGSEYWVTFMGGLGGDQGGSVGVFDAETNELLETIVAPVPDDLNSDEPFILYPHGISANEELGYVMVTSTIHYDLATGVGNTTTLIDMETREVVETYLVADSVDDLSSPVEVLLLRNEFPDFALVNTMIGGDIWVAGFNEETGIFDDFTKAYEGEDNGTGWALEFYIGPGDDPESDDDKYLYVSHAQPGQVDVYSLENLPELELVKTLPADAGAHHMAFFLTQSGREVMVVQNNLLNLNDPFPYLNAGTLMVVDIHSGEVLDSVDLPESYNLMPESIELAIGHGHYYHH